MPKSKRELLSQLADKVGGKRAEKLRAALNKASPFDDILDRPLSDEEFAVQMNKMEGDMPQVFAKMDGLDWDKTGTWGLPN